MLGFCGKIEVEDMKMCLINNLYPPYARGGAEQVAKTIAELCLQRRPSCRSHKRPRAVGDREVRQIDDPSLAAEKSIFLL